jgi:hypothetical protein
VNSGRASIPVVVIVDDDDPAGAHLLHEFLEAKLHALVPVTVDPLDRVRPNVLLLLRDRLVEPLGNYGHSVYDRAA